MIQFILLFLILALLLLLTFRIGQLLRHSYIILRALKALGDSLVPVELEAETFEFYTTMNGQNERVSSMLMKIDQRLPLSLKIKDKKGNAAKVHGVPAYSLTDESIGSITPSADGMSAMFTPNGKVGSLVIQVKADADMGEGERIIMGSLDVEVLPGDAVGMELEGGALEDQSSPQEPAPEEPVEEVPAEEPSEEPAPEQPAEPLFNKKNK